MPLPRIRAEAQWQGDCNAPELVPAYSSLEVYHPKHAWLGNRNNIPEDLQAADVDPDTGCEKEVAQTVRESSPQPDRRKRLVLWGCAIVLIILAAVLGGVLGSRRNSTGGAAVSSPANATAPISTSPSDPS